LVQESTAARKTHGDCVIADALTLEEGKETVLKSVAGSIKPPQNSTGARMAKALRKKSFLNKRKKNRRMKYNFG
jgi:hypothetical protein